MPLVVGFQHERVPQNNKTTLCKIGCNTVSLISSMVANRDGAEGADAGGRVYDWDEDEARREGLRRMEEWIFGVEGKGDELMDIGIWSSHTCRRWFQQLSNLRQG